MNTRKHSRVRFWALWGLAAAGYVALLALLLDKLRW